MTLVEYDKKNLFNEISTGIQIEFDSETKQYSVINDDTPGFYGVGYTKDIAIMEYLSALKDMILVSSNKQKNETEAFA